VHEASIMEAALQSAEDEARRAGADRITRLRLRVGVLSGVVPEALEFAFESLREGTMAAGAALDIETVPAVFRCLECGAMPELDEITFACPACRGSMVVDHGGNELELSQLEVDGDV